VDFISATKQLVPQRSKHTHKLISNITMFNSRNSSSTKNQGQSPLVELSSDSKLLAAEFCEVKLFDNIGSSKKSLS
jgi:hypothetical protein